MNDHYEVHGIEALTGGTPIPAEVSGPLWCDPDLDATACRTSVHCTEVELARAWASHDDALVRAWHGHREVTAAPALLLSWYAQGARRTGLALGVLGRSTTVQASPLGTASRMFRPLIDLVTRGGRPRCRPDQSRSRARQRWSLAQHDDFPCTQTDRQLRGALDLRPMPDSERLVTLSSDLAAQGALGRA
jgi:hypothetical protein